MSARAFRLPWQVALKAGEPGKRVSDTATAEVSYWTAVAARGQGVATVALPRSYPPSSTSRSVHTSWVHTMIGIACRGLFQLGSRLEQVPPEPGQPVILEASHRLGMTAHTHVSSLAGDVHEAMS